jgi:hypothetical protein
LGVVLRLFLRLFLDGVFTVEAKRLAVIIFAVYINQFLEKLLKIFLKIGNH